MNKLDNNYIKKIAEDTWEGCHGCDENDKNMRNTGFREGASYILALDLPVKFAEWKDKYTERQMGVYYKSRMFESGLEINKEYTNESLYQYWIDNVYKPE